MRYNDTLEELLEVSEYFENDLVRAAYEMENKKA